MYDRRGLPRTRPALIAVALVVAACSDPPPAPPRASGGFVGAATCGECHTDRWRGFRQTAHHLTSQAPSNETIRGSFDPPANRLVTGNPELWFEMDAKPAGYFVTAHLPGGKTRSERFDVVIGSGKLGQTYLYWRGAAMFELPVSYFSEGAAWRNSPGTRYKDGTADFDRVIMPRCLECHATWFGMSPTFAGGFVKDGAVLGISCERCHGPGAEHVAWHRTHPDSKDAVGITSPADLTPERSLELCGQCHGGVGEMVSAPFSYRPGDVLADHVHMPPPDPDAPPGVHSANQLLRLKQSRCFRESPKMTCATCHDPHVLERGDLALFSKRCLGCHEAKACGMEPRVGPGIAANCVDCHMNRLPIHSTVFDTPGAKLHPTMVDHHVGIDRAATEKYFAAHPPPK